MQPTQIDTQIAIVGAGPSGLLLSQLLNKSGIKTAIIERSSKEHVLSRIRAGVLERGTVQLLEQAGVSDRMHREGHVHEGCLLSQNDLQIRINFKELTGASVMVYGQTEVTKDLYDAQDEMGTPRFHEVSEVQILDLDQPQSRVSFEHEGQSKEIRCDFVVGCDGFHGVSRQTIPKSVRKEFEKVYPFGWLGILSETPPCDEELIYAHSERGFALASMRNPMLSRYYIQVPLTDTVEDWSDDAFWAELKKRLPSAVADRMVTGPSIEKSIAPLRSFVSEPMRYQSLFLCGDASHIVPPTGAKGLNLAASDVHYLVEGLIDYYHNQSEEKLDGYSDRALARVWQAMRFSWSMTTLLHQFPEDDAFTQRMQPTALHHLAKSETARQELAENYIGLPF